MGHLGRDLLHQQVPVRVEKPLSKIPFMTLGAPRTFLCQSGRILSSPNLPTPLLDSNLARRASLAIPSRSGRPHGYITSAPPAGITPRDLTRTVASSIPRQIVRTSRRVPTQLTMRGSLSHSTLALGKQQTSPSSCLDKPTFPE